MNAQQRQQMLETMLKRGGPYAGADIPEFYEMMEGLFTPQEAEINHVLSFKPAPAAEMARQLGRDEAEITTLLEGMVSKGLCAAALVDGKPHYQAAPFMPGIFEFQFIGGRSGEREKKIARLIHAYKDAYNASKGEQKITFPLTRVIPVDRKIDAKNTIHTYDQVATYIQKYDDICVGSCYCRHAAGLRGEDLHDMPVEVCMWFGKKGAFAAERLGGRRLTKEEARKILDTAEEAGLVHMSRNTTEEIDFLCNCDRWHCDVMKAVLRQPKPGLVFNSGFQPRFDPEKCIACETCVGRCPSEALSMGENDVPVVNLDLCFGCAVCATGCEQGTISMEAKTGFPEPPKTTRELVRPSRQAQQTPETGRQALP